MNQRNRMEENAPACYLSAQAQSHQKGQILDLWRLEHCCRYVVYVTHLPYNRTHPYVEYQCSSLCRRRMKHRHLPQSGLELTLTAVICPRDPRRCPQVYHLRLLLVLVLSVWTFLGLGQPIHPLIPCLMSGKDSLRCLIFAWLLRLQIMFFLRRYLRRKDFALPRLPKLKSLVSSSIRVGQEGVAER